MHHRRFKENTYRKSTRGQTERGKKTQDDHSTTSSKTTLRHEPQVTSACNSSFLSLGSETQTPRQARRSGRSNEVACEHARNTVSSCCQCKLISQNTKVWRRLCNDCFVVFHCVVVQKKDVQLCLAQNGHAAVFVIRYSRCLLFVFVWLL